MKEFINWALPLIGAAIISGVVGFIIKKTLNKRFDEQKELEELREEKRSNERKQAVQDAVKQALSSEISRVDDRLEKIEGKMNKLDDRMSKVEAGSQATLRNSLLTCYYKCYEKGFRNSEDIQNWDDMYVAYKDLDGNSFIDDIRKEFNKLPNKGEYEANKKAAKEAKRKSNQQRKDNI